MHERFSIEGRRGTLPGEVRLPDRAGDSPVVVFANGFLLPRGWGFYPYLAERLAGRGFACVLFDASGPAGGAAEVPTISELLGDLEAVLDAVAQGRTPGAERVAREGFGLVGHGIGGALALLQARGDKRVRAVVTLAACARLDRFEAAEVERLEREGRLEVAEPWSGGRAVVGRGFLEDLRRNAERFSVEAAVRSLRAPVAFVHGEEDHFVPVDESESLYHWSDKDRSRLIVLEKTGHSFGAVHPFEGGNRDLDRLVTILSSFLRKHVGLATKAA